MYKPWGKQWGDGGGGGQFQRYSQVKSRAAWAIIFKRVYSAGIVTWLGRMKPFFFSPIFSLCIGPQRLISTQVQCRLKSWFVRVIVFSFTGILKITRKATAWVHQGFFSNWHVNLTKSMPYLKCVDFSITQFHFH